MQRAASMWRGKAIAANASFAGAVARIEVKLPVRLSAAVPGSGRPASPQTPFVPRHCGTWRRIFRYSASIRRSLDHRALNVRHRIRYRAVLRLCSDAPAACWLASSAAAHSAAVRQTRLLKREPIGVSRRQIFFSAGAVSLVGAAASCSAEIMARASNIMVIHRSPIERTPHDRSLCPNAQPAGRMMMVSTDRDQYNCRETYKAWLVIDQEIS